MNFTWKPFFNELFLNVIQRYNSQSLVDLAYEIFPEKGLMERDRNGNEARLKELDPCTFMARFNRKEREGTKIEYCKKAKEILGLKAEVPMDFNGIPIFQNMAFWFIPWSYEQKGFEIDALWTFARELTTDSLSAKSFDTAYKSKGAGLIYLTTVCYIVNPAKYLPLDRRTEGYLEKRDPGFSKNLKDLKKLDAPFSGYKKLLDIVAKKFPGKDFSDISLDAYLENAGDSVEDQIDSAMEDTRGIHYWTISAGHGSQYWDEWQQKNIVSIGWSDLGDLSRVKSLDEVTTLYKEKYKPENSAKNNILANYDFAHRLKENDIIFVKNGRANLFGIGRVTSGYRFDPNHKYSHIRSVEWLATGDWPLGQVGLFAVKTLTDITQYDSFVEGLLKIAGLSDSDAVGGLMEKAKKVSLSKNTIFWGPPGTGKTHRLLQLQKHFTDSDTGADMLFSWVQDLGWWDVIAAALIDIGKPVLVPDLFNHEFIQAKVKQSNNKTPKNTIWGQLQAHTIRESKTVAFEKRQEPLVVDKSSDSKWVLVGDWKEQLSDLVEEVKKIRTPSDDASNKRYEMVTFHQSYSYEEFVEGIRPEVHSDGSGVSYQVRDGVFKKICQRAEENPEKDYAIFIDEINRGNLSKIFGELITLIEEDKRQDAPSEVIVTLPYSGRKFSVPSNFYIIGTMNSVDRSIALVDMALRRRFDFVAIRPDISLVPENSIEDFSLRNVFANLNNKIAVLLGTEYQVGHSYFMGKNASSVPSFKRVWFGNILPLLQEYLFDDWDKLQALVGDFVTKTEVKELEKLSLPKSSFGSFVSNDISDEEFVENIKKIA